MAVGHPYSLLGSLDLIEPFKQGMHFLWVDKSRPWSKEPSVGCGKEKVVSPTLFEDQLGGCTRHSGTKLTSRIF